MAVMMLAVVLLTFTLAVSADAKQPSVGYLSRVSIVRSLGIVGSLDPGVVARIRSHPAVERVIPIAPRVHMARITIPPFTSAEASPFAVSADDMAYLVELYGLAVKAGRLPHAGSSEMVISEALALNRDIRVGDAIGDPAHPTYPGAPSLPVEFVVSGVFALPESSADGSGWSFISLEFLQEQQPFPLPDVLPVIVVPKTGQKQSLDRWLLEELSGSEASVLVHSEEASRIEGQAQQDMLSMALLESIVAAVAALGLAVLNYIFADQRQPEFGLLHALGYGRGQLVRRVVAETAFTTGAAWGLSVVLTLAGMLVLQVVVFRPRGLTFGILNLTPWLYTLPIPIAAFAATTGTTARTLSRLDPVSIVERR
jgi:ABC-type lipoprotein release transport system permease subunit